VSLPRPVQRGVALSRQVHETLTESLVSGRIAPNERLVVEHLAEQLGVSPTPVREAVNRLLHDEVIEEASNGKFHVIGLTPDYVVDTFRVRARLEGLAVELAVPRMPSDHLAALTEGLDTIAAVVKRGEYEVFSLLDDSLHQSICDAAQNRALSRALRPLQIHIGIIYSYVNRTYSREQLAEYAVISHQEHQQIVAAMEQRDAIAAAQLIERHVLAAGERYAGLVAYSNEHPDASTGMPVVS
jgi:DNA-binding GntR family transcriptional regulator